MHRETVDVYEQHAEAWRRDRAPHRLEDAEVLGGRAALDPDRGPVIDLGCGPGWYTPFLGRPVVALDASLAMLRTVPEFAPDAWRVQADLAHLPFRRGSCRATWAAKSYVHLPRREVPRALAELHQALVVGGPADLLVFGGDRDFAPLDVDDFAGRYFSEWEPDAFVDVVIGAGFTVDAASVETGRRDNAQIRIQATRALSLPDWVGPEMGLLVVGLNPSIHAADMGVGFGRPGNRFWPAALDAGIVSRDRDPRHALDHHGVGMTDLVKRATTRADELDRQEYRDGLGRVKRLVAWLKPRAVCMVGLSGWRTAVNRKAVAGVQVERLGDRPVYVMPNTSGLNAGSSRAALADHLRAAARLADR